MNTTYSGLRVVVFVILVAAGWMGIAATAALFARHWKLGLKLGALTVLGFTFATIGGAIIGASRARASFDGGNVSTSEKARRLGDAISTELIRVALGFPLGLLLGGGHAYWGKRRNGWDGRLPDALATDILNRRARQPTYISNWLATPGSTCRWEWSCHH